MKSPFPGMDPYLEKHWRDVHHRLCTYSCDMLQPQVRPALVARLEERPASDPRTIYPDVNVVERAAHGHQPASTSATAVLDEPLVVEFERPRSEQATEGFIQIIDPTTGGQLITVIEFLSMSNISAGRTDYIKKQWELFDAGVSLVEIDLLRSGEWTVQAPQRVVPPEYRGPYRVCVHRGWKRGEYEVYRVPLEQRLPTINIPLRQQDADARLNLQALIEQTYVNGAYDSIDYRQPPDPPLSGELAPWSEELLAKARRA